MNKKVNGSKDVIDKEALELMQPKTYWEQRCFMMEQFQEIFVSVMIQYLPPDGQEVIHHLISKYNENVANIVVPDEFVVDLKSSVQKAIKEH